MSEGMAQGFNACKSMVNGENNNKYNTKSMNIILSTLSKSKSNKVIYCDTPKEMIDKLQYIYEEYHKEPKKIEYDELDCEGNPLIVDHQKNNTYS